MEESGFLTLFLVCTYRPEMAWTHYKGFAIEKLAKLFLDYLFSFNLILKLCFQTIWSLNNTFPKMLVHAVTSAEESSNSKLVTLT